MYDNIHLIDQYINKHQTTLTPEDISIIKEFKKFRRGTFYIMKFTQKYALFLDEEFVFGVSALGDPFDDFWDKRELPVLVETVLLPFKGKIIYDGFFLSSPIRFGSGISSSLKAEVEKKISQYGIILELPIDDKLKNAKLSNESLLIVMMKTKSSRENNWYEIEELVSDNPELLPTYNKEWGRINSRNEIKEIKLLGVKNHHFGIYKNTIIANGKNQVEAEKNARQLIKDKDILKSIFYFKV